MNILWLSWRDIKNPRAGGAEKVTFEIAKRLAAKDKHKVTLLTSAYKKSKPQESVKNIKIIRKGNEITCRIWAFVYYLKNSKRIDLIVDEINTIPFFTPLFAPNKSITLIHQLAKEYWQYKIPKPFSSLFYFLEPNILKIYRKTPAVTVSKSTYNDLKKLKIQKIKIVREGLSHKPKILPKNKKNVILFLGRISPVKKPQDAISAFQIISEQFPNFQLLLAGKGEKKYIEKLKTQTKIQKIENKVKFLGYVSENKKIELLKQAKIILIPSIREGWGLVASEAQSYGCIPIAYNVPGLCDSIENNKTGFLIKPLPRSLAQAAIKIIKNVKLTQKIQKNAFLKASHLSWENTYHDFKASL